MMFPIRLKERERHRDPARLYYLVASNGLFQVRKTETHRSVTRVTNEWRSTSCPRWRNHRRRCIWS